MKRVDYVLTAGNVVAFPDDKARAQQKPRKGVALTKAGAKKLTLPAGKSDVVFWDDKLTGFGLRIWASGKRVWVVQFRDSARISRRLNVGGADVLDADEARAKAKLLLAGATTGNDPAQAKREARAATRMGDLVEPFLTYAAKRQKPSTFEATTRNMRNHAKPLHSVIAKEIGRADIAELHDRVTEKSGPVQANRVLASLSGFFAWAIGRGQLDINPVLSVPKHSEEARERTLSDDEIRAIWSGTASGSDYDCIVRLLLLTGARRTEVGSMQWSEIVRIGDTEEAMWTIPKERMKNAIPHEIPLCEFAIQQLPQEHTHLPPSGEDFSDSANFEESSSKFVFGKAINGERRGYSGWSRSKARFDRRLGFSDWSLHDFRRTLSTRLHEAGVQPHIVEALLAHIGHKSGVAGTYNLATYRDQKREALQLWEQMILRIVSA